jgi:hypothetical protein
LNSVNENAGNAVIAGNAGSLIVERAFRSRRSRRSLSSRRYYSGDNGSEIRRFNLTALDKIIRAMLD